MSLNFAVLIPLGPGMNELFRVQRVIQSLLTFEPRVGWVVLIDDDMSERRLEAFVEVSRHCKLVVLKHPRNGAGIGHLGGLFVGIMYGLQWIAENTSASFVLKLDTDSLVIRPFSEAIYYELSDRSIGQIGTVGHTCNRNAKMFGVENRCVSPLLKLHKMWKITYILQKFCRLNPASLVEVRPELRWCIDFNQASPIIMRARLNGYETLQYCQGGAYVVSAEMLQRLLSSACFQSYHVWKHVPVGEDVIMGMYTYSTGLRLLDRSDVNQPFGLHWRGLPFEPLQIIDRKYSIVHSLKGDRRFTENALVELLLSKDQDKGKLLPFAPHGTKSGEKA